MKKWLSATLIVAVSVILAVFFSDNRVDSTDFVRKNGQLFLVVDFYYEPEIRTDILENNPSGYVYFESFDEMISDMETQNFTEDEWDNIRSMMKVGSNLVSIPDIYNLYEPVLPSGTSTYPITWSGSSYWMDFSTTYGFTGSIRTIEDYETYLEKIPPTLSEDLPTFVSKEYEEERNATVYKFVDLLGKTRIYKVYQIPSEGKTIWVEEEYNPNVSLTIPETITVIVDNVDVQYEVFLRKKSAAERPSVEWLQLFGIRPYNR